MTCLFLQVLEKYCFYELFLCNQEIISRIKTSEGPIVGLVCCIHLLNKEHLLFIINKAKKYGLYPSWDLVR